MEAGVIEVMMTLANGGQLAVLGYIARRIRLVRHEVDRLLEFAPEDSKRPPQRDFK